MSVASMAQATREEAALRDRLMLEVEGLVEDIRQGRTPMAAGEVALDALTRARNESTKPILCGDFVVDVIKHQAVNSKTKMMLQARPKVRHLFEFLATNQGRCFSREELFARLWGDSPSGLGVITVTVLALRHAVEATGGAGELIQTRRGYGYGIGID